MNRHPLQPHPRTDSDSAQASPVSALCVWAGLSGPLVLQVRYVLTGELAQIRFPPPGAGGRADGLWRHTCFEAFVRLGDAADYLEFNFSPSGQWQAYRFEAYRRGGSPLDLAEAPRIAVSGADQPLWQAGDAQRHLERPRGADRRALEAQIALPEAYRESAAPLRLGLSAVVETDGGRLSYWALRHPPGRPDFHHPETFSLVLTRP